MWEAFDLGNEDFLWAGIPFMGGISGQQQAPCGAVSASAVYLGLRHRCSLADRSGAKKSRDTIRHQSAELVKSFNDEFGNIVCKDLLGIDFTKPGAYQEFSQGEAWKGKCERYVQFTIEKLYQFEDLKVLPIV